MKMDDVLEELEEILEAFENGELTHSDLGAWLSCHGWIFLAYNE